MGLSKEKDIDPWLKRFRELDTDGSGRLDEKVALIFFETFIFVTLTYIHMFYCII